MQTATVNKPLKVYVAVKADFAADGTMFPSIITWEDGEKYEIDRVSDIRQAPALKAGARATAIRYGSAVTRAICFSSAAQTLPETTSDDGL